MQSNFWVIHMFMEVQALPMERTAPALPRACLPISGSVLAEAPGIRRPEENPFLSARQSREDPLFYASGDYINHVAIYIGAGRSSIRATLPQAFVLPQRITARHARQ